MNNKITYHKVGDYYLLNLILEKSKYRNYSLSKYGRMRLNYLKNHKKLNTLLKYSKGFDSHSQILLNYTLAE